VKKGEERMSFKRSLGSALTTLALAGTLAMPTYAKQAAASVATTKASRPAAAKSSVVEHAAQGSVVTMTDKVMVVRVKKDKDLTLAIGPNTEKIGNISSGQRVTVHYRNEKGQHVATSIQQSAAPQTSTAAKPNSN
jgi:hypothetical protein